MEKLIPPDKFPFPFEPYDIQKDFMEALYNCIENKQVGIFESPTGSLMKDWFKNYFQRLSFNIIFYQCPNHKSKKS